jgi:alanine dehydrogenase
MSAQQDSEALAIKAVSLFPTNPARGLAYIQAAVLVFEPQTGRAIALLEGSSLTAIRTGAAGGAAIDLLARRDSRVAAIFGAGAQGRTQLEAACTARNIETVSVFDSDTDKAEAFAEEMAGQDRIPREIRVAASSPDRRSNMQTSSAPPQHRPRNRSSMTVMYNPEHTSPPWGSYTPEMCEISGRTVARARLFVDSRSASLEEAGDLIQPIRAGLFDESHIHAELGEVILGRKSGREHKRRDHLLQIGWHCRAGCNGSTGRLENAHKMKVGRQRILNFLRILH